jgi:hypothetical protein
MFVYQKSNAEQNSFGIYKDGVSLCRMKGDQPVVFRILPAFPPHKIVDGRMIDPQTGEEIPADAWVPFIDEKQRFFDWITEIRVAPYVGHGNWKQRRDVVSRLSLATYDEDGNRERVDDPYFELQQYVKTRASATWGYLQKGIGEWGDKDRQGPPLPFIGRRYLMNIVRMDDMTKVQIGELSVRSAADALLAEDGLAMAPNKHATDEMIQADYLNAYDNGDFTDPVSGKVFMVEKDMDSGKGQASPYKVSFVSQFDRTKRRTVYQTADVSRHLSGRYDLADIESIVKIPTCEEQVRQLVDLLNGRDPTGEFHEYSLMKEAWEECGHPEWAALVPEPPVAVGVRKLVPGYRPKEDPPYDEPEDPAEPAPEAKPAPKPAPAARPSAPGRYNVPGRSVAPAPQPAAEEPEQDTLPFPVDEPEEKVAEEPAVETNKPVEGVPGEATPAPGDWKARYMSKYGKK